MRKANARARNDQHPLLQHQEVVGLKTVTALLLSLLDIIQNEVELGKQGIYSIMGEQPSITWIADILWTNVDHRMDKVI